MAIKITENGVVRYENEPNVDRLLFPNVEEGISPEQIKQAVDEWLEDHPEATTTVMDGSITRVKLDSELNSYLDSVDSEIDELKENLTDLQEASDTKAAVIYETASGEIASFSDGADDMPMKSCVISIEPIQEGTGDPSPENVRPISGRTGLSVVRTGKNLIPHFIVNDITVLGLTLSLRDDGTILISGIPTNGSTAKNLNRRTFNRGELSLKAGTYTFKTFSDNPYIYVQVVTYDNGTFYVGTGQSTKTIETDFDVRFLDIGINPNNGESINMILKPQLEFGSTATDYEPYKGAEVSVNWETEAGTVYGATLDVVRGKLTVDRGYIASYNGEALPSTWISDRDVYAAGTAPTTGAQVVYKLAEPVEYQLTPQEVRTLLGVNNVWSDGGDMAAEYPADTKLYIEKLTQPTENDMIADHAISANNFFMVGNTLYRATTAIASGATITVGTNAVKMSLSDALNALA